MQTALDKKLLATEEGKRADAILRSCVHCGFCNAVCPTYLLKGDELDGPRGRIYLIQQLLQGEDVSQATMTHLDRCLTCLSCQTTCPSGVRYGQLLDIGRHHAEAKIHRPRLQRWYRKLLLIFIPHRQLFSPFFKLGQLFRPLLPAVLKSKIPPRVKAVRRPLSTHQRKMLILDGCVQPVIRPSINNATAQILDRLGIEVVFHPESGCCGALSHHLAASSQSLKQIKHNIDCWWPDIESGAEAIISTASGCGVFVKDYGDLLKSDPDYADKARRISAMTYDISEILAKQDGLATASLDRPIRVAFHVPCTLQHGQSINGVVEGLLQKRGYILTESKDSHLCCGSAGTYSLLQSKMAKQLLISKISCLEADQPDVIVTANIGCQLHLASRASVPVQHWIELLAQQTHN